MGQLKTIIKKFDQAVDSGKFDEARQILKVVDKKLKKATSKNVLHKNAASRQLSRLSKKLNK